MTAAPAFPTPVVLTRGNTDTANPLVVLLHGRGAAERDVIGLADALPIGPAYVAVRAPIAEGHGFAWFANRGIGRPHADSLRATMNWFRDWLEPVAPAERPVLLIGFSGGAAFAGGLVLDDPIRFAGAAILCGTIPFDAGVPTTPARLSGLPVFLAHGADDTVIPRDLQDRTWRYLTTESGAPTVARKDAVGHSLATEAVTHLSAWIQDRVSHLAMRSAGDGAAADDSCRWSGIRGGALPPRRGPRPQVSTSIPQQQTSDNAPPEIQQQLFAELSSLPGVTTRQSVLSVPGASGFMLADGNGPADAFLVVSAGEFAHLHPSYDGSMHLALPGRLAADAVEKGWAVAHPLAGTRLTPGMVLIYGPRDAEELAIVAGIARTSHDYASGGQLS
ncbi:luciferase family protein [Pseudonocardia sp.]|uniref:luciferase domain-containing protein n=1 Tax=Pseudonocardia sp. TaxID=60912 RepID=UPI003D14A23A